MNDHQAANLLRTLRCSWMLVRDGNKIGKDLEASGLFGSLGAEVVVPTLSHEALDQAGALALILVMDSSEVLISTHVCHPDGVAGVPLRHHIGQTSL